MLASPSWSYKTRYLTSATLHEPHRNSYTTKKWMPKKTHISQQSGRLFVADFVCSTAVSRMTHEDTASRLSFLTHYGYWFNNSGAFLGLQEIPNPQESSHQSGRFNITAKWPCLQRGLCLFSSSLHIQRFSTSEFPSNTKPRLSDSSNIFWTPFL